MINNQKNQEPQSNEENEQEEEILCPHCKRTATNGIKCKGICVADSDY
ncbi:hypothetical protein IQ215_06640 [Cyanobacterium stanieri LEGE 03274]|uniref:Uncharacterized protein n=1 Tax=Cyanobacterium stanieri LEGE 03274 TaxID=1828756 RepID=A0ABR9V398_9CHRO|nr:hypothetical protein [Cyanobacterium stanieri]MBE9222371.1 hypothetical protein [Cyanobacterium stanieri LEGE 03274]